MDSQQINFQLLAARVANLEASNRRWKAATIVGALLACSLLLMAAKPADRVDPSVLRAATMEAQEFVLKGEDGHVYARLTLNSGLRDLVGKVLVPGNGPASPLFENKLYSLRKDAGPALQFYNERGDVIWTAPSKPEYMPAK
jgi:hypothetical protein